MPPDIYSASCDNERIARGVVGRPGCIKLGFFSKIEAWTARHVGRPAHYETKSGLSDRHLDNKIEDELDFDVITELTFSSKENYEKLVAALSDPRSATGSPPTRPTSWIVRR